LCRKFATEKNNHPGCPGWLVSKHLGKQGSDKRSCRSSGKAVRRRGDGLVPRGLSSF
jgi:hypothetical protein